MSGWLSNLLTIFHDSGGIITGMHHQQSLSMAASLKSKPPGVIPHQLLVKLVYQIQIPKEKSLSC